MSDEQDRAPLTKEQMVAEFMAANDVEFGKSFGMPDGFSIKSVAALIPEEYTPVFFLSHDNNYGVALLCPVPHSRDGMMHISSDLDETALKLADAYPEIFKELLLIPLIEFFETTLKARKELHHVG